MEAVVWLEDYLAKFKKILMMVSHSQVSTPLTHMSDRVLTARAHWPT
jgi:ATPase subunit of ABC transporter with duplicated ATPase domains